MKKIVLLCILLLLTFSNTATAANWQHALTTENGAIISFDDETLAINEYGYLDVWVKVNSSPQKNTNIAYLIFHEQYNKTPRRQQFLSAYAYDANGNIIDQNVITSKWTDVIPDSYNETLYKIISHYYTNKINENAQNL